PGKLGMFDGHDPDAVYVEAQPVVDAGYPQSVPALFDAVMFGRRQHPRLAVAALHDVNLLCRADGEQDIVFPAMVEAADKPCARSSLVDGLYMHIHLDRGPIG